MFSTYSCARQRDDVSNQAFKYSISAVVLSTVIVPIVQLRSFLEGDLNQQTRDELQAKLMRLDGTTVGVL
jgi:hypothetical protein